MRRTSILREDFETAGAQKALTSRGMKLTCVKVSPVWLQTEAMPKIASRAGAGGDGGNREEGSS
jgi:hypothetical protein